MNNYVTFNSNEFSSIRRENNYCLEEEILGEEFVDELEKRGIKIKYGFFLDYGFSISAIIKNKSFNLLLTCINDKEVKFGISVVPEISWIERLINNSNKKEILIINQLIDDLLHLNKNVFNINWIKTEELNKYEDYTTNNQL